MATQQPPKKKRKVVTQTQEEQEQEEDDNGCLLTKQLDYDIQTGLHAIRNDDPLIYNRDHSFINSTKSDQIAKQNNNKYPWVKQLENDEQDTFLKQFFENQLWKCDEDDTVLSSIGVHRGYEGVEHNLDDIDLSDDDKNIDKQNDFERNWQKKNSLQFEKEIHEQINMKQHQTSYKQTDKQQTEKKSDKPSTIKLQNKPKPTKSDNNDTKKTEKSEDDLKVLAFLEDSD